MLAAGQADLRPLPGRIGLARAMRMQSPPGRGGDVLDIQRHQLGAAQRAGEADQQQRAVTPPAGASSQVASRRRSIARVSAAAFCPGRP